MDSGDAIHRWHLQMHLQNTSSGKASYSLRGAVLCFDNSLGSLCCLWISTPQSSLTTLRTHFPGEKKANESPSTAIGLHAVSSLGIYGSANPQFLRGLEP